MCREPDWVGEFPCRGQEAPQCALNESSRGVRLRSSASSPLDAVHVKRSSHARLFAPSEPSARQRFSGRRRIGGDGEPRIAGGPFIFKSHCFVIRGPGRHERRSARPRGLSFVLVAPSGLPVGDGQR